MISIKDRKELIDKFLKFFKGKDHKSISNSSLIPKYDSEVLFTTAGMHPLIPFLMGKPHPKGRRLCNVQKCVRTQDIEEVGDKSHLTFFEMLGNWSLGDYFKKEAVKFSLEFLTRVLKIPKEKLEITCFKGDPENNIPKDEKTANIWKEEGIEDKKIRFLEKEENWWGPAEKTGPCGPDTEIFYDGFEIWNNVFMQYNKDEKGKYKELKQKNVDTGMGVERTLTILQGKESVYETHLFVPIIKRIEELSGKKYGKTEKETKSIRIIADHIKAAVFILAEKIKPGNVKRGYVLRRLIRRAIRHGKILGIEKDFTKEVAETVFSIYSDYDYLEKFKDFISKELEKEEEIFSRVLKKGVEKFEKIKKKVKNKTISGKSAFLLYQSYGFPIEMIKELSEESGLDVDIKGFRREEEKHKEKSRNAKKGQFKSGLASKNEEATKLHTATHLLLAALKKLLGEHVNQRGSNINKERLRFDFSHDKKLTEKEVKKVESEINKNIEKGLNVKKEEMSLKEAKSSGATGIFDDKYGDKVSVYTIYDPEENKIISKEICAGPHVKNTKELGKIKIIKQKSVGKGVRRIKAILE